MAFRHWLELWRPHTAGASGMVPVVGAACAGASWELQVGLFFWGVLVHVAGFTLNNVLDFRYDTSKGATYNTIVAGKVKLEKAKDLFYGTFALALASGLGLAFFAAPSGTRMAAVAFLGAGLFLGVCYDRYSKETAYSGVVMGSYTCAVFAFGYFVGGGGGMAPYPAVTGALIWLYMFVAVSVDGGFKDADDFAARLGLRREGGKIVHTGKFLKYAVVAKVVPVYLMMGVFMFTPGAGGWVFVVFIGAATLYFLTLSAYLFADHYDRPVMLKWLSANNVLFYVMIITTLVPVVIAPLTALVYVAVPLGWFILLNRAVHGRWASPNV